MRKMSGIVKFFKRNTVAYMFLAPWLLGFLVLTVYPMIYSLWLGFTNYDFTKPDSTQWIGLGNYLKMFGPLFGMSEFTASTGEVMRVDPYYLKSLSVTFTYVFVSVPLKLIAALGCGDADEPETAGSAVLPRRVLYPHAPRRLGGNRGAVEEAVRERRPGKRLPGSHWLHQPPRLDHQPQLRALDARSADGVAVRLVDDYLPRGAEANPGGVLRGGKRGRREPRYGSFSP